MVRYDVDIYADTICPWCYIGKETLGLAIERHRARYPEDEFYLTWRPFLLFPNAKVSAYSKEDIFLLKFGADAPAVLDRMERAGAPYGLHFNWDGRTGSSRDSHKLILLAAEQDAAAAAAATISSFSSSSSAASTTTTSTQSDTPTSSIAEPESPPHGPTCPPVPGTRVIEDDADAMDVDASSAPAASTTTTAPPQPLTRQDALIHALLQGALTQGEDISDRAAFLIPLGLAHRLASSAAELVAHLDSAAMDARVDAETVRARRDVGITAVPSYVVNGRYRVGGMQEPGVFTGLFERIREAKKA